MLDLAELQAEAVEAFLAVVVFRVGVAKVGAEGVPGAEELGEAAVELREVLADLSDLPLDLLLEQPDPRRVARFAAISHASRTSIAKTRMIPTPINTCTIEHP